MPIVQLKMPLADVLIETAAGVAAMNRALSDRDLSGKDVGVRATSASVEINFAASLTDEYKYEEHTYTAGGYFNFWILGGAGAGWYSSTELSLYQKYAESIRMTVKVNFEATPIIIQGNKSNPA